MEPGPILPPEQWAKQNFGAVKWGDARRNRRVVQVTTALARHPSASLPAQLADGAALKATYRLLENPAVLAPLSPHDLTTETFWLTVARYGGYLSRKRDGPPGWHTLWQGWLYIQTLLEGIRLASSLSPPTSG